MRNKVEKSASCTRGIEETRRRRRWKQHATCLQTPPTKPLDSRSTTSVLETGREKPLGQRGDRDEPWRRETTENRQRAYGMKPQVVWANANTLLPTALTHTWVTQTWASMPKRTMSVGLFGSLLTCAITSSVHIENSFFSKIGTCYNAFSLHRGSRTETANNGCAGNPVRSHAGRGKVDESARSKTLARKDGSIGGTLMSFHVRLRWVVRPARMQECFAIWATIGRLQV